MLGKIEGRKGKEQQRMRWLDGITNSMNMSLGNFRGDGDGQEDLASAIHGVAELDMTDQPNRTESNDQRINPRSRYNNYKYICTQHRRAALCKANAIPTSNTEEAEVEQFYEDLQDLLELTPKKDIISMIGDSNAKVGTQEILGLTGKFGCRGQN